MEPEIIEKRESNGILQFTLGNVNVSIANALRRILLSEIPVIVFKTSPHDKNDAVILFNNTRMNNEILKQRLSCIPIYINDIENFPLSQYILEIDKENDSDIIQYATTKDFQLKNTMNGQYLAEHERDKIFPPDPISNQYIDFVRLRPQMNTIQKERIHLTCKLSISNAKEDAMFNVVSTCAYGNTKDEVKIAEVWSKKHESLKQSGMAEDEIAFEKKNWMSLDAQRYSVPNSYNFTIESIGVYSNMDLFHKGCQILVSKFENFRQSIQNDEVMIHEAQTTNSNFYDIILENEDYTMGKVLEYLAYRDYFDNGKILNFCGFQKIHPHDDYSILRVGLIEDTEETKIFKSVKHTDRIKAILNSVCSSAEAIFNHINTLI